MNPTRLVAYVDIDDTLVRSVGTKRIPMPSVVQYVRELRQRGAKLYGWSSGGAEYARSSADELGIADCFEGFLPKPNLIIDDQAPSDWRDCRHMTPLEAANARST
jgi:hypothetical protein